MLKRYSYHETLLAQGATAYRYYAFFREQFPHPTGYVGDLVASSGVVQTVAGPHKYVYGGFPLIHYVSSAFAGRRGGVRYLLDLAYTTSSSEALGSTWSVARSARSEIDNTSTVVDLGSTATASAVYQAAYAFMDADGHSGIAKWSPRLNTTFSFEVPYYSRYRFEPSKRPTDFTVKESDTNGWCLTFTNNHSSGNADVINSYVAGAEDFTCFFYLGPPRFYDNGFNPPTA
jgi:hypothetical protein